jgi:hypothetical protein
MEGHQDEAEPGYPCVPANFFLWSGWFSELAAEDFCSCPHREAAKKTLNLRAWSSRLGLVQSFFFALLNEGATADATPP